MSKKGHTVANIMYGSMDLVGVPLIDTNIYNIRFNDVVALGDPIEKITGAMDGPSRQYDDNGVVVLGTKGLQITLHFICLITN